MARPGRVHAAGDGLTPPAPLDPATAAVPLTLVDGDTPLWLDAACAPARDWIAFHCGAVASAAGRAGHGDAAAGERHPRP
jgi:alpha-D-ribose 1-methylphosphonate 5-triphosphate synthase subunit PhnH